jgi:hypothetical protein
MIREEKTVDGFRFLPPGLKAWIRTFIPEDDFNGYIPLIKFYLEEIKHARQRESEKERTK